MPASDRERREELESLQARTRSLKADAALEESADLPERREALKAELTQVQAALPPLEEETGLLESTLAEVQGDAAELEERHRLREHSSLTWLAVPVVFGTPLLALWAFERVGAPIEIAVFTAGFALPALWLGRVVRWRPPPFNLRGFVTGALAVAALAGAVVVTPYLGGGDRKLERALATAALALSCVALVTSERARRPDSPRGIAGIARTLALIVLGVNTLYLLAEGGLFGLLPLAAGFTVSLLEDRWRTWLQRRAEARAARAREALEASAAVASAPDKVSAGPQS